MTPTRQPPQSLPSAANLRGYANSVKSAAKKGDFAAMADAFTSIGSAIEEIANAFDRNDRRTRELADPNTPDPQRSAPILVSADRLRGTVGTGVVWSGQPIDVAHGGTGATTAAGALSNLGAAASGANSDITSLSGLTTPLAVNEGGTSLATLTAHALYVGNGTSAPTALAVGATGTVLHGTTGANPSFSAVVLTTDVTGILPVANGGTGVSQQQHSEAYNSGAQSITSGAYNALTFDTNVDDVGGIHSTSVNPTRFTIQKAGWYYLLGQCSFAGAAGGTTRQVSLYLNGANVTPWPVFSLPPSANVLTLQVSHMIRLAVNDYVEFMAFQDSGGNVNTNAGFCFGCVQFVSL